MTAGVPPTGNPSGPVDPASKPSITHPLIKDGSIDPKEASWTAHLAWAHGPQKKVSVPHTAGKGSNEASAKFDTDFRHDKSRGASKGRKLSKPLEMIAAELNPMVVHLADPKKVDLESALFCLQVLLKHESTLGAGANQPGVPEYLSTVHNAVDTAIRISIGKWRDQEWVKATGEAEPELASLKAVLERFKAGLRENCIRKGVPSDYPAIKNELVLCDQVLTRANSGDAYIFFKKHLDALEANPPREKILLTLAKIDIENRTNDQIIDKNSAAYAAAMKQIVALLQADLAPWSAEWVKRIVNPGEDIGAVAKEYWASKCALQKQCNGVARELFDNPAIAEIVTPLDKLLAGELSKVERGLKSADVRTLFRTYLKGDFKKLDFLESVDLYRKQQGLDRALRLYSDFVRNPIEGLDMEEITRNALLEQLKGMDVLVNRLGKDLKTADAKQVDTQRRASVPTLVAPNATIFDTAYRETMHHIVDSYRQFLQSAEFRAFQAKYDR